MRNVATFFASFATLVILSSHSFAENSQNLPPEYESCIDAADGAGAAETAKCADEANKKQDAELNNAYRQVIVANTSAFTDSLRISELAWLVYRDKTCNTEGSTYLGMQTTSQIEKHEACVLRITAERIYWLKRMADPRKL